MTTRPIPRYASCDESLALLMEGYEFVRNRCARLSSDIFATRLLLQNTICLQGEAAARMFYESECLTRQGGLPRAAQKTLTGQGAVMLTDGEVHRSRKHLFMSLMTPERIAAMSNHFADEWAQRIPVWQSKRKVLLFDEMQEILFCSAAKWTGIPVPPEDVPWRTFELGILIDGAGGIGPRHWQARAARQSLEYWISSLVEQVRRGTLTPEPDTALHVISFYRDPESGLLDARLAAVELINILRPTVAVAYYIAFAGKALHEHPAIRTRIAAEEQGLLDNLVHEVRRFYAFFPFVAARVRQDFEWNGYAFRSGTRVMLDIYGTSHDARLWDKPELFNPDRFHDWNETGYRLIPQGAGDYDTTHRCAGEWLTIELMRVAVLVLAKHLDYRVPVQDLSHSLRRMPMLPNSHFVMEAVQLVD